MKTQLINAPIALFVYHRLWHTQRTVEALLKNALAQQSDLIIFSDGAKNPEVFDAVNAVRDWLPSITGFKHIEIIHQPSNLGLAQSIIQGVTQVVNTYGRVIVMEDDLVVSPFFLQYMNDALEIYKNTPQVASIHGYGLPLKEQLPETYFMRGADCWGWATWQRAWAHFEADGQKLLRALQQNKLVKIFDFDHTQANIQMLKDQIRGKNNSWAIRWHASAFLKEMVTLYPGRSLVNNIGMDNTGEHCGETTIFNTAVCQTPVTVIPQPPLPNPHAYRAYVQFFKQHQRTLLKRVFGKLRKLKQLISL